MSDRALVALGIAAVLLSSCSCEEPPAPFVVPSTTVPPPPAVASARPIAADGAFDLVATPEGALLAWGPPQAGGGGVRAILLSPVGTALGLERDVAGDSHAHAGSTDEAVRPALEVVAVSSGSMLGIAWVVDGVPPAMGEATVSSGGLEGFAPAFTLGLVGATSTPSARGRLAAIVGEDGALRVRIRTPARPCDRAAPCEGTTRIRLDDADHRREGPAEAVPSACEPFLVGTLATAGTYFHGLCHVEDAGTPSAMVYSIDPEPMHAAATDPLPGCAPLGLAPAPGGVAVVSSCPEGVSVAWLDGTGVVRGVARPATRSATCTAGRPTLRIEGEATLEIPLTTPLSRIETLLGEPVASDRARAIWTGAAILVAEPRNHDVWIERWECNDAGVLMPTTPL